MPTSDDNLNNGKMTFDCPTAPKSPKYSANAALSQFRFRSDNAHRLRLMNTGADAAQKFSLDGHDMTVISNDFVAVEPYTTNVVTLGVGQPADVIIDDLETRSCRTGYGAMLLVPVLVSQLHLLWCCTKMQITRKVPTTQPQYYPVGCAYDALGQTVPQYSMALKEPEISIVLDATVRQDERGIGR